MQAIEIVFLDTSLGDSLLEMLLNDSVEQRDLLLGCKSGAVKLKEGSSQFRPKFVHTALKCIEMVFREAETLAHQGPQGKATSPRERVAGFLEHVRAESLQLLRGVSVTMFHSICH